MNGETYLHYGFVLKNTAFVSDRAEAYIPYDENTDVLFTPCKVSGRTVANRIQYQPMEGQDADGRGAPTDETLERYKRLARGGAGTVWVEAVSVCPEGRSNPHQLMLTEETAPLFTKLVSVIKSECLAKNGFEPLVIMQMNHSGRYSKPNGKPEPITAYFNPEIEDAPKTVASDDYLDSLVPVFINCAVLAARVGFDGIDVKACHGYLMSELLSAYDREGRYGGCFENRSRLFNEVAAGVNTSCPKDFIRAARVNVFDGYGDRYSFCEPSAGECDLTEAHLLVDAFTKNGGTLLDVTMGSPYRNPDVSRPYRMGLDVPPTNAVRALSRLWAGAAQIKKAHGVTVVNTGISLLGGLSPYAAAGAVSEGMTDLVGFGRMSFAYPDLAADLKKGAFDASKACVCCGGCSYLKKNLCKSGCIVRNDYYKEIFKEFRKQNGGK